MRIVIFEDRMERLNKFIGSDLEKHPEVTVITDRAFENSNCDLEQGNTASLTDYDCIAAHRSALKAGVGSVLKSYCKTNGKSLIFFSGGITSSVFKDKEFPFLLINSRDFYSPRLLSFIGDGQQTNVLNLLVLQFGDRWKLNLLLNLRNHITVGLTRDPIRMRDLKIHASIKKELQTHSSLPFLEEDEHTAISSEQVKALKSAISHLINGMV